MSRSVGDSLASPKKEIPKTKNFLKSYLPIERERYLFNNFVKFPRDKVNNLIFGLL